MKTRSLFASALLALTCGAANLSTTAFADDYIKLQVAVKSDNDNAKAGQQETHRKWLEVSATAFHLPQPSQVRIEWTFFGDDLKADKVVKNGQGSESTQLEQSTRAVIKTKPVAFTYTPRHSEKTGSGKRAKYKTIEATGTRYHGWAVRAFVGDRLAGEEYSAAALKKLLE